MRRHIIIIAIAALGLFGLALIAQADGPEPKGMQSGDSYRYHCRFGGSYDFETDERTQWGPVCDE